MKRGTLVLMICGFAVGCGAGPGGSGADASFPDSGVAGDAAENGDAGDCALRIAPHSLQFVAAEPAIQHQTIQLTLVGSECGSSSGIQVVFENVVPGFPGTDDGGDFSLASCPAPCTLELHSGSAAIDLDIAYQNRDASSADQRTLALDRMPSHSVADTVELIAE